MTSIDRILASDKFESFGKASAADIARYKRTFSIDLSDGYCAFLRRCNGMSTSFDFDEVGEAGLHMALADINTIHGIGNGLGHADLALMTPRYDENGTKLNRIAPMIGVGGDFCTYVEISKGYYDKQIMYTDGEMYWSYVKRIDWDEDVDMLIGNFIDDGFFMPVAEDFDALLDMYAKLV